MTRLDQYKQGASGPMQEYVDTVWLLFAKTGYPAEGQVQKFMAGLNDNYKDRVQRTMPLTLDDAVKAALYMEDFDLGSSPEKIAAAKNKQNSGDSDVARLAKDITGSLTQEFTKMSTSFARSLMGSSYGNNGR